MFLFSPLALFSPSESDKITTSSTSESSENEWWPIVNGIPIRYLIREHALLTGLCYDHLPLKFENIFEESYNLSLILLRSIL